MAFSPSLFMFTHSPDKCFLSALAFIPFDLDHKKHQTHIKADAAPSLCSSSCLIPPFFAL